MQLVGMLDSPFVRRVAVTLVKWGVPFVHRPVSLFRHLDVFAPVNPMLKAPTLVTDEGVALMDSNVILEWLAAADPARPTLWPRSAGGRLAAARLTGVGLTLGEKAVQLYYEGALRPPEKQHEPWRERVIGQFEAGLAALEAELPVSGWIGGEGLGHADIAVACMTRFAKDKFPDRAPDQRYARLAAFCARAEALPEFRAVPAQDGATAKV